MSVTGFYTEDDPGFKLNAAKTFCSILLNREFFKFYGHRNKIQALTEDRFLCVGKRKIFGIVTTGLSLSSDESQVIERPVNSSIRSDEGLTLETSAFESLYGGQFTLSTQLTKLNYLVILPPTQHHSFFRNLPP